MPIAHFAIHADDISRAQRFYAKVFAWKFDAFGPPGFFMIDVSVADIDATAAAIPAHGGNIVMPIVTLPGIGRLLFFEDPEGSHAGAMQSSAAAD